MSTPTPHTLRRLLAPTTAVALTLGMVACGSQSDTEAADHAAPTTIATAERDIDLPDGAWDAATAAAEQCDQATAALVAGTIATVSGYDADYSDQAGREGYGALTPVAWDKYGTDDPAERNDLDAATDAVAAQLCDGFAAAETIAEEDPDADVDQLALSVVLFGERYTAEYGVTEAEAEHDPLDQRVQITAIQDAAASVSA